MPMRIRHLIPLLTLFVVLLAACGEETAVVDSGVYEGTISEVNAAEEEIYVDVPEAGLLELYFTDTTTLTRGGETVPFSDLAVDQAVRVEVEKVGQRLDPVSVEIVE